MIMAGRGRRLGDVGDESRKVGTPRAENTSIDMESLTKKINEIDPSNINISLLNDIESMFKQIFTSKEIMKEVILKFHDKSVEDADFGEKFIIAIERVLNLVIDDTRVRSELLSLIQNDFINKKETYQTNLKKFLNSVTLFGNVYKRIKVSGRPIAILAPALFEYFEMLLKGGEEELKTLIAQIFINGKKLSEVDSYKQLMQNLRNILINGNLNSTSKCWILLAIDFTANGFQPLKDGVRDFYKANLGAEFQKMEKLIEIEEDQMVHSPTSPSSGKSQDSGSPKNKKFSVSPKNSDNVKKDLSKKFSDMSVKSSDNKLHSPSGKTKNDNWKPSGDGRRTSGHDDRFHKDENFYGVQRPRQPKADYQRKKFDDKSIKNEFDHFKPGVNDKESQPLPAAGENLD